MWLIEKGPFGEVTARPVDWTEYVAWVLFRIVMVVVLLILDLATIPITTPFLILFRGFSNVSMIRKVLWFPVTLAYLIGGCVFAGLGIAQMLQGTF
ncbi:MAG: hypothetical protein Kow00124_31520 [Anaerolineae bacterium]